MNNGVYRAGFATTQAAYEEAFGELFAMLDRLEHRLRGQPFLLGEQVTETDWRLFTTLAPSCAVVRLETHSPTIYAACVTQEGSRRMISLTKRAREQQNSSTMPHGTISPSNEF